MPYWQYERDIEYGTEYVELTELDHTPKVELDEVEVEEDCFTVFVEADDKEKAFAKGSLFTDEAIKDRENPGRHLRRGLEDLEESVKDGVTGCATRENLLEKIEKLQKMAENLK